MHKSNWLSGRASDSKTPPMYISSPEPKAHGPASGRRSASSSFTMLKDLLLPNRFANQSQILCGASLGRGNDILFAASESHD